MKTSLNQPDHRCVFINRPDLREVSVMKECGSVHTKTISPPGCKHLRKEIRNVPGIRKKLMFGRCMLKRDEEAREEIRKAASDIWADSIETRDCGFFESGQWDVCPRYTPVDQ